MAGCHSRLIGAATDVSLSGVVFPVVHPTVQVGFWAQKNQHIGAGGGTAYNFESSHSIFAVCAGVNFMLFRRPTLSS